MHELAVTRSILDTVLEHALAAGAQRVLRIHLRVGALHEFQSEWIQRYFDHLSRDTAARDAALVVEQVPAVFRCPSCALEFEVALGDVRKSINFCRTVHLDVLGLIENMGPFNCPCCGKPIALFRRGGGEATAAKMGVAFLGTLPFDGSVVGSGDRGLAAVTERPDSQFSKALEVSLDKIIEG